MSGRSGAAGLVAALMLLVQAETLRRLGRGLAAAGRYVAAGARKSEAAARRIHPELGGPDAR